MGSLSLPVTPFAYGETITRLRRAWVLDPYSGESTLGDWSTATEESISGCAISPLDTSENPNIDRDRLSSFRTLYAPPGTDITAEDRIRDARGVLWDVDGHPFDWTHPMTGWRPGVVVSLKRSEAVG